MDKIIEGFNDIVQKLVNRKGKQYKSKDGDAPTGYHRVGKSSPHTADDEFPDRDDQCQKQQSTVVSPAACDSKTKMVSPSGDR